MIRRNITQNIEAARADTPVVFLQGARQTGKSTLARDLMTSIDGARYVTFDDATTLSAATGDPEGFVRGLPETVVLDEVQRAPAVLLAIKAAVDHARRPGRFFLTGSANVLLLPRISESLAGRMELHTLWPFSQGELARHREGFVDALFSDELPGVRQQDRPDLLDRLVTGGFPEIVARKDLARRQAWFGSYVTTILQRDVRDMAHIEGLTELPRILSLVAARSGALLNSSEISRSSGVPQTTLKRYMAFLEMAFLIARIPAWSSSVSKRFVRSPKLAITDSGLACSLLGVDRTGLSHQPEIAGRLCEGFVAMEVVKQLGWSRTRAALFHYRTHSQREVDLVLEGPGGRVVGIEVKTSASLSPDVTAGLRDLSEAAGRRFHRGVILYAGEQTVPFSRNIHAIPMACLWRW